MSLLDIESSINFDLFKLRKKVKKIVFIIPPAVELLNLAGPMQVFEEAKFYGLDLNLECYTLHPEPASALGLPFCRIPSYQEAKLNKGDFIFIPGVQFEELEKLLESESRFFEWLRECDSREVNICSVCNAAFFLGKAGLLDQRECTTHWRRVELMQTLFPKATVLNDVLFVKSDTLYTSAGISAGIDPLNFK